MDEDKLRDVLKELLEEDDKQSASRDLLTPEGVKPLERIEESPDNLKTELVPFSCGHFAEGSPGRACYSCHAIVCAAQTCDRGTCSNPLCGRPICLFCSKIFESKFLCVWCISDLMAEKELKKLEETYGTVFPWITDGDIK